MDSKSHHMHFGIAFENTRTKRLATIFLLIVLIVSVIATLLIWQWRSRISLDKHWWYTTQLRIETSGKSREQTFQFLGTRVNRGIFVVETYTIQEWDEAQWAWVPSKLPAGSTVEIISRIIMDRKSVRDDIEGAHTEDRHCFIGSVALRRDLLWAIVGIGCAASVWLLILTIRSHRRLRRFTRGLCPDCAYPLLDGELVTCPECGLRILREEAPRQSLAAGPESE